MFIEQLALIAAASFTSAAAYINGVEQPARLLLESESLLAEWKVSYQRGTIMQVSLAVTAAGLGTAAFVAVHDWRWLCGSLLLLSLLPYTFLGVMPTNRRLMATSPEVGDGFVHSQVRHWGYLHAGRTALGMAATLAFLWATL